MRGLFWEIIINEVWKNGWLVILCLLMLFGIKTTSAQVVDGYDGPLPDPSIEVLADSSNFVTSSLLIASATNSFFSVFGHAALRMQCPAYHLDYVFTFESDPSVNGFIQFFIGKAKARYISVPASVFFEEIEKREVVLYIIMTMIKKKEYYRPEGIRCGALKQYEKCRITRSITATLCCRKLMCQIIFRASNPSITAN